MDNSGFTFKDVLIILFINIIFTMIMAFIATNATMSSLERAKQGSAKDAGYGFIRAVEYSIARATMETSGYVKPIYITTGDIAGVSMKGIKPTVVQLSLNNGVVAGGIIKINGYTLIVDSNGNIINQ